MLHILLSVTFVGMGKVYLAKESLSLDEKWKQEGIREEYLAMQLP